MFNPIHPSRPVLVNQHLASQVSTKHAAVEHVQASEVVASRHQSASIPYHATVYLTGTGDGGTIQVGQRYQLFAGMLSSLEVWGDFSEAARTASRIVNVQAVVHAHNINFPTDRCIP